MCISSCDRRRNVAAICHFWHRAPKALGIFWIIGVSLVTYNKPLDNVPESVLMKRLTMSPDIASREGLATLGRLSIWIEGWNFQPQFWLWRRKGTGYWVQSCGQWFNQLVHKSGPWGGELPGWWPYWCTGRWHLYKERNPEPLDFALHTCSFGYSFVSFIIKWESFPQGYREFSVAFWPMIKPEGIVGSPTFVLS